MGQIVSSLNVRVIFRKIDLIMILAAYVLLTALDNVLLRLYGTFPELH